MKAKKILFVCVHNSARSQMAEAFVNALAGDRYLAESAGLEPTVINPLVVEVMAEAGFDLAGHGTRSVFELFAAGSLYDYVVTVCDQSREGQCPIFPGVARRLHISFPDPAVLTGSREERLAGTRIIRDAILERMRTLIAELDQEPTGGKLTV